MLRLVVSNSDFIAFSRTINIPKRGFGQVALDKFREKMQELQIDIFSLCQLVVDRKIDLKFSLKQMQGLEEYVKNLLALRMMNAAKKSLSELLSQTIERSRYIDYLKEDSETYEERRANIEELSAKATEWQKEAADPTLANFLEELTLKSSSEDPDKVPDAVKLMTLHNGKGLEFPLVFLVGMEEDLFPHINAKDSESALEEERRLCYVGLTRAKDYLFVTAARYRFLWGCSRDMRPSRFLKEIPSKFLQVLSKERQEYIEETEVYEESTSFESGDRIFHKDFGTGVVHKAYQTSLGLTYDVFFLKTQTVRSLAAKYAKLIAAP